MSQWEALRDCGHWSGVLALHCAATPARPADRAAAELVVGEHRVDLAAALTVLGEREGMRVVRVDSGGALNGALLAAGLVDEVSLLVHPALAGARVPGRWYGAADSAPTALELLQASSRGRLVWLHYRVVTRTRG